MKHKRPIKEEGIDFTKVVIPKETTSLRVSILTSSNFTIFVFTMLILMHFSAGILEFTKPKFIEETHFDHIDFIF